MQGGIEFEINSHEYTVHEFYKQYRDSLPQLAVVTQGYFGEIGIETFGRGQALRIFACYTQKRVMASVYHEVGRTPLDKKLLSIPLDGNTKFHLTDAGTQDTNEYTLTELLETEEGRRPLPIDIQFADETQARSVGFEFREVDRTLHIRIFEQFDEIFLLGNPLCDGYVYAKVVELPFYLPTMKMSVATGIKGYHIDTWRRYKMEMRDSIEKNARVNAVYGRKDIAVYTTDVLHTYESYTFLEPTSYIKAGPDESNCRLSLNLEFIFEPLFLANEKRKSPIENEQLANQDRDSSNTQTDESDCAKKALKEKDEKLTPKEANNEVNLQENKSKSSDLEDEQGKDKNADSSNKEYKIEFDHLQEEMPVKEFYERFKDDLPKVILITQGYHGEIGIESFGRGQIIRIHTAFKQRRVKAEVVHGHETGLDGYQISIPLDYKAKFCEVIKHLDLRRLTAKERTIAGILKRQNITQHPEIKFSKLEESYILNLDPKLRKTTHNIHLKLLEEYDDIYLLGNPISEGCLYARVMAVPVYLPDLKLSIISGIKGCSNESWEKYQAEMTETVKQRVDFDCSYGNENIAIYSKEKNETVSNLAYVSPKAYCESVKTSDDSNHTASSSVSAQSDELCLYKPLVLLNKYNTEIDDTSLSGSTKNQHCDTDSQNTGTKECSSEYSGNNSLPTDKKLNVESKREEKFGIQFEHEDMEYSVRELYDAYKSSLPVFVIVAQGHYGDVGMETLDIDQVIRVHTYVTQKRVIAKVKEGHKLFSGKRLSIPVDYPLKFKTVEKESTQSNSMFLQKVLDSNQFPVDIQLDFSEPDQTCLIGQRRIKCKDLPILEIVEHIEVIYLIGNPISDGCLYSRIVEIPISLPDVKLSIVTGAKHTSEKAWQSYIHGMADIVQEKINFYGNFSNTDINLYSPDLMVPERLPESKSTEEFEDVFLEVENSSSIEDGSKSPGLLAEVIAAACGRRPESVCLYEPHLLTIDMNIRLSKGQETSTDDLNT